MKKLAAILAAAAPLAALATVQDAVAAPAFGPVGAAVTCGAPGAPGYLLTRTCIEVTGNQVRVYGWATPNSPAWQPQPVGFTVAATVIGNAPIPPVNPTVLVSAGGTQVGSVFTTAPCGSTVIANFAVNQPGWPSSPATVSTVVSC
ncbi:hypothetical protein ACIRPK_36525 [Kitasatospora sp. NPDC101801]|uniref:hypothetical protein n=1 Tax=Kitasatospora sp. NPDC101801 TaxID=3364103 RepID=UPI003816CF68